MDYIAELLGPWSQELNLYSTIFRIVITMILSAIIGCERSSKRHSAGLRTFMLISLAGCIAMMIEIALPGNSVNIMAGATIVAIASLSSHSLFTSSRNQIRGLTTSAGLWTCGIIGMSIGAGFYTVSFFAYLATLATLSFFPALEKTLKDRSNHFEVHLELTDSHYLQNFVTTIRKLGLEIDDIEYNPAYVRSGLSVYSVAISITSDLLSQYKTHQEIIEALKTLDYVYHIEELQ